MTCPGRKTIFRFFPILFLLVNAGLSSCHTAAKKSNGPISGNLPSSVSPASVQSPTTAFSSVKNDILADNIDPATSPAQDFYQYADGGWLKRNPVPPGESEWSVGSQVQEDIYARLRTITRLTALAGARKGTVQQQIGDLWISGMDTASIEEQGLQPLQPELDRIRKSKNKKELLVAIAVMHKRGSDVLFEDGVSQDDKNSGTMSYQLTQGGIGMPNRDYYFNADSRTAVVRAAYRNYIYEIFLQLGETVKEARAHAITVFRLEKKLAAVSRTLSTLRDPVKNYTRLSVAKLTTLSPGFDWLTYLGSCGIRCDSLVVRQPEFFTALAREFAACSLEDWKNYLRFHLLHEDAPYLGQALCDCRFRYVKTLTGASEQRPRWKKILDAEEGAMGEALGQLFVKEYFTPKARERYTRLIEEIRDAYKERIRRLDWLSDATRRDALVKLASIRKKVGYPDKWLDFSSLTIDRGPFVLNMQRARQWWRDHTVRQLGRAADRDEWSMSPQTFNAYYTAANNEVVFPAGIFMVPGKKDEELDDAFVYGYTAAGTIGHEITHGFDDEGRQYDEKGNLRNWWSPSDEKEFTRRANLITRQFNEFNPVDTLHVNGSATRGENIADLGGLVIGIDAFKRSAAYRKGEKIGGFTPLQRFFLGYAFSWANRQNQEILASSLLTDTHAPSKERVNGPLVNTPEFYEAFGIKPGDKMYRPDSLRVRIW